MTYNETVRDTYFQAASKLYTVGANGPEAHAEGYLKHAKFLENLGHEHWPATVRQERRLARLRWSCERNTAEQRERQDREFEAHLYEVGRGNYSGVIGDDNPAL